MQEEGILNVLDKQLNTDLFALPLSAGSLT